MRAFGNLVITTATVSRSDETTLPTRPAAPQRRTPRRRPGEVRDATKFAVKLDRRKAEAIRLLRREYGMTYAQIARIFGVHFTTVCQVVLGRRWA